MTDYLLNQRNKWIKGFNLRNNNLINSPVLLNLINVSKFYNLNESVIQAVHNVNLQVLSNEFVVIMGPSGSGKSTLLSIIATLENPSSGQINLRGTFFTDLNEAQRCNYRTNMIGIVFQFFKLHSHLTAQQNVELPMILAGIPKKVRQRRSMELLELVRLSDRRDHYPDELSGGENQRVGIARALSNNPPLLIADEPTGHLDSEYGQEIISLFLHLNKANSKTIIMVSHDERILQPGMRVLQMKDGYIYSDKFV